MINSGLSAPDFTLLDQNNNEVSLSDFKGKKVVLYFYPKANTSGCTLEATEFAALNNEFTQNNTVIIGMSRDSVATQKKFTDKYNLPFILLSDPEHKVIEAYGAWREKKLYGKVSMGIVRSTYLIDEDSVIIKAYDNVKSAGHAENVLQDVIK